MDFPLPNLKPKNGIAFTMKQADAVKSEEGIEIKKEAPGDKWFKNQPQPVINLGVDPWVKDCEFKFVIVSVIQENEYQVVHFNDKKRNGTLLKVRGLAVTEKEADELARYYLTMDPLFDIQVLPIGEWRPLTLEMEDTIASSTRVTSILKGYVDKEKKELESKRERINSSVTHYRKATDQDSLVPGDDSGYVAVNGPRTAETEAYYDTSNVSFRALGSSLPDLSDKQVLLNGKTVELVN